MDRCLWKAVTDSGKYDDYVFLDHDSFVDFVEATELDGAVPENVTFEKVTIIGGL